MGEPGDDLDAATESEDKRVALLIAILALFLAISEAGAKKAEHSSTEFNIESSDLYNYYQTKRVRAAVAETAAKSLEASLPGVSDDKAKAALEAQVSAFKAQVDQIDKDPKSPQNSLEKLQERAKEATETRESWNRKLEHFEYSSGCFQISIVLASAAIITGVAALAWISGLLGVIGLVLLAFGYFAPTVLTFLG